MEESANKFKDEELILYGSVMYLFVYSSISRLQFSDLILYKKCKDIIQALETFLLD